MSVEARIWDEERHGWKVTGPCWTCGSEIRYFVDEDGTPLEVSPVYDGYQAATDAAMNFGDGYNEGKRDMFNMIRLWRDFWLSLEATPRNPIRDVTAISLMVRQFTAVLDGAPVPAGFAPE